MNFQASNDHRLRRVFCARPDEAGDDLPPGHLGHFGGEDLEAPSATAGGYGWRLAVGIFVWRHFEGFSNHWWFLSLFWGWVWI